MELLKDIDYLMETKFPEIHTHQRVFLMNDLYIGLHHFCDREANLKYFIEMIQWGRKSALSPTTNPT